MTPQRGFSNVPSVVRSLPDSAPASATTSTTCVFLRLSPSTPSATRRPARARTRREEAAAAFFPTVSSSTDAASVATPAHARALLPHPRPRFDPSDASPIRTRRRRKRLFDLVESRTPDLVESASQWWSTFQSSAPPPLPPLAQALLLFWSVILIISLCMAFLYVPAKMKRAPSPSAATPTRASLVPRRCATRALGVQIFLGTSPTRTPWLPGPPPPRFARSVRSSCTRARRKNRTSRSTARATTA